MATLDGAGWVQSSQTSKALQDNPLHKPHITGGWPEEPFQYQSSWLVFPDATVRYYRMAHSDLPFQLPCPSPTLLTLPAGVLWEKARFGKSDFPEFIVDCGMGQEPWNNSHKAMPDTQAPQKTLCPLPQGLDTQLTQEIVVNFFDSLKTGRGKVALLWVKFVSSFHLSKWKKI